MKTSALLWILLGLVFWAAFQMMAPAHEGWALGLGNTGLPAYRFIVFVLFYGLFGGAGAICIAIGATRLRIPAWPKETRGFLLLATACGVIIPAAIRGFVLQGAVLADDESVFRFSAHLLASGRLTAPSHPLKLFFDHAFMVNDGLMFSQYFLGWPTIMAAGVPFGLTGYVNSLVSGATVPALYELLKKIAGANWARLGVLVFLTSPMIQIAAATELSHTSALGALVYAMWFVTLALRGGGGAVNFAFGLSLAVAFFIRPASAVSVALPWGLLWAWKQVSKRAFANVLWFLLPTVVLAGTLAVQSKLAPHPPQLVTSEAVLISQPSASLLLQSVQPAEQDPIAQVPLLQAPLAFEYLVVQLLLQEPQLVSLVPVLVSQPSAVPPVQSANGATQAPIAQVPAAQYPAALG